MHKLYSPKEIEYKVQLHWNKKQTFKVIEDPKKEKYYCLVMIPYPSGNLHMGHVRNYTIGDIMARYNRMLGKNVLHPIGWDAFGLPAENSAIINNIHPKLWTKNNIIYMKKQLMKLGFSYDWSREISTCNPKYYIWEQKFFIRMYKKGLVYKKKSLVNWCPNDKTVLANEQVINGLCWRCNSKIENRNMSQWFMKITNYAEELLSNLDKLNHWPEKVKTMQRNWIGKIKKTFIYVEIVKYKYKLKAYIDKLHLIMGITYIAISTKHFFAKKISKKDNKIINFIKKCNNLIKQKKDKSSNEEGIFTNIYAYHPFTKEKLPIWIINYNSDIFINNQVVLAIPGHNHNHYKVAKKYNIIVKSVLFKNNNIEQNLSNREILYNSGKFNGLNRNQSLDIIKKELLNLGIIKTDISYKIHDWNISRQRYWGVPIPMIILDENNIVPVDDKKLPVILSENIFFDKKSNFIKINPSWYKTVYLNKPALKEKDTFDTFMESSWYYARYTCKNYENDILDTKAANYWLPVDLYIGGIEHAIMHLMYFRFYHKLLRDSGLVESDEPVKKLVCQGMVLTKTFYYVDSNGNKKWISPSEVSLKEDANGKIIEAKDSFGNKLIYAGISKMSKSKNNGVDPELMIEKYGADTVRLFIIFAAPVDMPLEWNELNIKGVNRFIKKLWKLVHNYDLVKIKAELNLSILSNKQKSIRRIVHKTIIKVSKIIDQCRSLNTAVSDIMKIVNILVKIKIKNTQDHAIMMESLSIIIRMLYPFIPHVCFVLWRVFNKNNNIDDASWPKADKLAIKEDKTLIIVQINGKLRDKIIIPYDTSENEIINYIKKRSNIKKYFLNNKISRIIYLPNKLINLVSTN